MQAIEEKIGYSFRSRALLVNALTHSSYANENRGRSCESNERLEFLGDSVLGMVVAEALYRRFPDLPEGRLTRMRAQLVCEESLHRVAGEIGLGAHIRLGKGEEHTGGRTRTSILADATEALIAAMYLDGGMDVARGFIERYILPELNGEYIPFGDAKTDLQELIQKKSGSTLSYELVGESGPDHDKTFTTRVLLNGESVGTGSGRTKKEAEQAAARAALAALRR
ncbi:MAG TPA: ribonuclease III [Candidatus Scatomorpha stercoravium]|nr:ribonuclease III [Candidatus Scatomorpha stercoravium]